MVADFVIPENLPIAYKSAIKVLLAELAENPSSLQKIFENFIQKYTMIPDLWEYWASLQYERKSSIGEFKIFVDNLRHQICEHFYHENVLTKICHEFRLYFEDKNLWNKIMIAREIILLVDTNNLYTRKRGIIELKNACTFPNPRLKENMKRYQKFSATSIDKKLMEKYNQSLKLYNKIMAADSNDIEWFKYILESNDKKFIMQNIENRISKNPGSQELWKLYINYLNESNNNMILDVYHRYCRLFIDDVKTRKKYFFGIKEINKNNNFDLTKWFIDAVKLEIDFGSIENAANILTEALLNAKTHSDALQEFASKFVDNYGYYSKLDSSIKNFQICYEALPANFGFNQMFLKDEKPITLKNAIESEITNSFNKNISTQFLFFQKYPKPIFRYILNQINTTFNFYIKFIKTCKFFFIQKDFVIPIWHLYVGTHHKGPSSMCHEFSASFTVKNDEDERNINDPILQCKIWIGNYLSSYQNLFTQFQNKIENCDIRYLNIFGEKLYYSEYIKLVKNGKIEKLDIFFREGIFYSEDGDGVLLKDILDKVPLATKIDIGGIYLANESDQKLSEIHRSSKLKRFNIFCTKNVFDPDSYIEFVKKFAAPKANLKIYYVTLDAAEKEKLDKIDEMFQEFRRKSGKDAPRFWTESVL